jgi:hypothetical protein
VDLPPVTLRLAQLLIETASKLTPTIGKVPASTAAKVPFKRKAVKKTSKTPDTGIPNKAMAILDSFINDIFKHFAREAPSKSLYDHCAC